VIGTLLNQKIRYRAQSINRFTKGLHVEKLHVQLLISLMLLVIAKANLVFWGYLEVEVPYMIQHLLPS